MIKKVILKGIRLYQKTLSYDHGLMGKIFPNTRFCKFTPTCSEYSYEAVRRYGALKGLSLSLRRIARCNPFSSPGKYDPVP